jgi:hypothetical protein
MLDNRINILLAITHTVKLDGNLNPGTDKEINKQTALNRNQYFELSGILKSSMSCDITPCSPLKFNQLSSWYLAQLILP